MNLNKIFKLIGFGFIIWLIPTLATLSVSYLGALNYFDVISSVSIAVTVIALPYLYFKDINENYVREGIICGVVWLVISIILDIVLIFLGINKITMIEYVIDIAPIYIVIPAITIVLGLYRNQNQDTRHV
jgi:amino acid transporter